MKGIQRTRRILLYKLEQLKYFSKKEKKHNSQIITIGDETD